MNIEIESTQDQQSINQQQDKKDGNIKIGRIVTDILIPQSDMVIKQKQKLKLKNHQQSLKWSRKNQEIFSRLINKFGTDFSIIAYYFQQFTNQAFSYNVIKNKYEREHKRRSTNCSINDSLNEEIDRNLRQLCMM